MFEGHHRSRQGRPHRLARCCFHSRPDDYVYEVLSKLVTSCITITWLTAPGVCAWRPSSRNLWRRCVQGPAAQAAP